jgi:hypothetical protein
MDMVYIDTCRYEIQEQNRSSGMVYRHISANLFHWEGLRKTTKNLNQVNLFRAEILIRYLLCRVSRVAQAV